MSKNYDNYNCSDMQLIMTTGGTFDKSYDALTGELNFTETHIPRIMTEANVYSYQYMVKEIMRVDSLIMTDSQRQEIADACISEPYNSIVVVHGTDTMVETARVIGSRNLSKCVVLTGAMRLFELRETDADTNLLSALSFAQILPDGCYICMGGTVFPYDNVKKNRSVGRFLPMNEQEWLNWKMSLQQNIRV